MTVTQIGEIAPVLLWRVIQHHKHALHGRFFSVLIYIKYGQNLFDLAVKLITIMLVCRSVTMDE